MLHASSMAIQLYIQLNKLSAARVFSIRGDFKSFPSSTFVCNLPSKHPHLCAPIYDPHLQAQAGTAFLTKYRLMMKLTSSDDLECESAIYLNLRLSLNTFFSKTARWELVVHLGTQLRTRLKCFLSLSSSFGNLYRRLGDVIVVASIRPGAILINARKMDMREPCSGKSGLYNLPCPRIITLDLPLFTCFRFHITEFKLVPLNWAQVRVSYDTMHAFFINLWVTYLEVAENIFLLKRLRWQSMLYMHEKVNIVYANYKSNM